MNRVVKGQFYKRSIGKMNSFDHCEHDNAILYPKLCYHKVFYNLGLLTFEILKKLTRFLYSKEPSESVLYTLHLLCVLKKLSVRRFF